MAKKLYKDIDNPEAKELQKAAAVATKPKYDVGALVRVSLPTKTLRKQGENSNWSVELFRVIRVQPGAPTLYWLADTKPGSDTLEPDEPIDGSFYENELTEAVPPKEWRYEVLKRERGRVYVHWVGWPSRYNAWIQA